MNGPLFLFLPVPIIDLDRNFTYSWRCLILVLSRKIGEKIVINNDITVTVIDIERGKIRLGFIAPRDVPIMRAELLEGQKDTSKEQLQ